MQRKGTFNLPPADSTIAASYDQLFYFIYWLSVFFFVLITGVTIYFALKYRKKGDKSKLTPGFSHNTPLELFWSIIPTILIFIIFIWGFQVFMKFYVIPSNAMEIRVTAWQWGWMFKYPEGAQSNVLVVPENRPIKLLMSSNDVIHSLFVPDFRVKMDVLPNRYSSLWFQSNEIGEYDLYCAEYCGQKHSRMTTTVSVRTQDEYLKWLKGASGPVSGDVLYTRFACNTCHSIDGSTGNGPTFKGLFGRSEKLIDGSKHTVDDNYLRESILEPNAKIVAGYEPVMPSFKGVLSNDQLDSLIDYIKSLKE